MSMVQSKLVAVGVTSGTLVIALLEAYWSRLSALCRTIAALPVLVSLYVEDLHQRWSHLTRGRPKSTSCCMAMVVC